jgi:DNA-binding MarR family transcriptional regulator
MKDRKKALYAVFSEVRTCFNLLKSLTEQLHGDTGVTPAMRAVLETLASSGPRTVPEIARMKGVSRQHIQMIVNTLVEVALAETQANPLHQKSQLVALTEAGAQTFRELARREQAPLATLASEFDPEALRQARATLTRVNELLQCEIGKVRSDAEN